MPEEKRRFGTLNGVFLPCILSLFGVILFLRTGWVVGNAGLPRALLILLISSFISLSTGLSVATIATGTEIGSGGTYYIISRNLGLDTGGAVGIPLYISQAISVAFYIIGFLEAVSFIKPDLNFPLWGTVTLLFFSIMVFIGADLAVNFQYFIFAVLSLGILSFLLTPWRLPLKENLEPHYVNGYNFWKTFSVFFPALVGIDAGIGLSGELREPEKNIPRGIAYALSLSILVYALVMIKASSVASYKELVERTDIFMRKSLSPMAVVLGIWAATLSSALTYSLAAPRTLQALAKDGVLPRFLAGSFGSPKEEPRVGVIVTFLIAEAFILLGSLNLVASVITMFFLISYSTLNAVSALQDIAGGPLYRPKFKAPWIVSAAGFFGCLFIMLLISPPSATIAVICISGVFLWLRKKEVAQTWGDVRTGVWVSICRWALLQLEKYPMGSSGWRPHIMLFSGNPKTRRHLVKMANWLSKGKGIVTLFYLVPYRSSSFEGFYREKERLLREIEQFILKERLPFFAEVDFVTDLERDIPTISQSHGIGKLSSNTALFGWGHNPERGNLLIKILKKMYLLEKNILVFRCQGEPCGTPPYRLIDIWWRGGDENIGLMLLVAEILKSNPQWKEARVRLMSVAEKERKEVERLLVEAAGKTNIDVKVEVFEGDNPLNIMKEVSREANLVIIGLPLPKEGKEKEVSDRINRFVESFHSVLLVRSAGRPLLK